LLRGCWHTRSHQDGKRGQQTEPDTSNHTHVLFPC
jgi:hypothetical protein